MQKNLDLRQKKVIDVDTAEQLGCIIDMDIDVASGKIRKITVSKTGFSRFLHEAKEFAVAWEDVAAVGNEYILVKIKKNTKIADKC